jgi:ketosteroid isomerase-like protein
MIQRRVIVVAACLFWTAVSLWSLLAQDAKDPPSSIHQHLSQCLADQCNAWNRGDIHAFMQTYWNSPELTFSSGGTTERGWQQTKDRYLKRYPDTQAMGKLRFSDLETTELSRESALMLGRWQLDKEEPAGGNFTLVWRRFGQDWKIVHDHTSANKESSNKP